MPPGVDCDEAPARGWRDWRRWRGGFCSFSVLAGPDTGLMAKKAFAARPGARLTRAFRDPSVGALARDARGRFAMRRRRAWGAVGGAPGSLRAWLWLAEARYAGDASISGPTLARARVGRRPSAIVISGQFARFLVTHRCGGYRGGSRAQRAPDMCLLHLLGHHIQKSRNESSILTWSIFTLRRLKIAV